MSKPRAIAASLFVLTLLLTPVASHASRQARDDITITYDGEFDRAHGVRSGHGTMEDPFVISGWTVNNISIKDTTKAIKIVNNTITGTLTLDWVGMDVLVSGNDVGDLRVNQNVARWGDPTSGTFTRNTFGQVGQLRHFDGVFSYNTVGEAVQGLTSSSYPDTRAVNFDGFNGAHFVHNTIYGYVDARLHGHHHSSDYGMPSHLHADGPHGEAVDHSKRYHEVFIRANKIFTSAPYALAYLDTNHAANDRTANSETNPWLNAPHSHWTRVHLTDNLLYGAGILVDVFNARDEKHSTTHTGLMDIARNRVSLGRDITRPFRVVTGIEVVSARWLVLAIAKNNVIGPEPLIGVEALRALQADGTGVLLDEIDHATITVSDQRVSNAQFGVRALQMTKSVTWTIRDLSTSDVTTPVDYDSSVKNPPKRS